MINLPAAPHGHFWRLEKTGLDDGIIISLRKETFFGSKEIDHKDVWCFGSFDLVLAETLHAAQAILKRHGVYGDHQR